MYLKPVPICCQCQLSLHSDDDTNLNLGVKNREHIDDEHAKIILVERFRIVGLIIIYNLIMQL